MGFGDSMEAVVQPFSVATAYRQCTANINEPGHSISNTIACVPSEDSDQPAHLHTDQSLRCLSEDVLDLWLSTYRGLSARLVCQMVVFPQT